MGTRSRTQVLDNKGRIIVSMYRQMDGYPDGHGADLMKFLESGTMVNGIGANQPKRIFNGVEEMAAKMVEHFKDGQDGSIYLMAPLTREELAEDIFIEYVYTVKWEGPKQSLVDFSDPKGTWLVKVDDIHGTEFFSGPPSLFLEFLENGMMQKLQDEAHDEEKCGA